MSGQKTYGPVSAALVAAASLTRHETPTNNKITKNNERSLSSDKVASGRKVTFTLSYAHARTLFSTVTHTSNPRFRVPVARLPTQAPSNGAAVLRMLFQIKFEQGFPKDAFEQKEQTISSFVRDKRVGMFTKHFIDRVIISQ